MKLGFQIYSIMEKNSNDSIMHQRGPISIRGLVKLYKKS